MREVLLISEKGECVGNMSFNEAKKIAEDEGLDLIEVNREKGVFKLGDQGKLKYEQKQKERTRRAQKRLQKIKEIQIRPTIDDGDLSVKMRRVREFLEHGMKTKVIMKFKKQQMLYKDAGMKKMIEIIDEIVGAGLASADSAPRFEGRNISVFLTPNK